MASKQPIRQPDVTTIETVAARYKELVLLVGGQLFLNGVARPGVPRDPAGLPDEIVALALLALLASGGLLVVTAYRLMKAMNAAVPLLWGLALLVPLVNLVMLLLISVRARAWCQRFGVQVGFFGPTRDSIERLRSASVSAQSGGQLSAPAELRWPERFSWARALLHGFLTLFVLGVLSLFFLENDGTRRDHERARQMGRSAAPLFALAVGISYLVQTRRRA
jgi:hypothetical protein